MLTEEEDVEVHALARRGWSIAAIARHTGRDRKTVRRYLAGDQPVRGRAPSVLEPYRDYVAARFSEDPHLLATVLFEELRGLGFARSYPTLVRELRRLELRPRCTACRAGAAVAAEIAHSPGEELQLDWLELSETPWGEKAYVLVGVLPFSGRVRGAFSDGQSFAHLVAALDALLRRLGGTAHSWRTDRMAAVCDPASGRLRPEFAAVARHYGAAVAICPANRPQRKGAVEAAIRYLTRSWWASAPVATVAQAQADLDRWTRSVADRRRRGETTVAELAAQEPLLALPAAPFPAILEAERVVSRSALVAFEGNRYSVGPELAGQTVCVRARLGELSLAIAAASGAIVARHRRAPAGAGQTIRTDAHAKALERVVLEQFTTRRACARKANRPPGEAAQAAAARLAGQGSGAVVVDLERYAEAARVAR